MKNDDYFVVAYKILNYLYECLKAGKNADVTQIDEKSMNINVRYWEWIMRALRESGRLIGVLDVIGGIAIDGLEITEEGIIFLQENSSIEKARAFLKETKAMVPGI